MKMQGNPVFCDKSKFCEYYDGHDHYTTDYRQLKVKIIQLLKQGPLKEFLLGRRKVAVD